MKKLLKIVFIFLSVINLLFSVATATLGIALNGNTLEPFVVVLTIAAIISTGFFLAISFVFIAQRPTFIAFIVSIVSAIALIVSSVILFS